MDGALEAASGSGIEPRRAQALAQAVHLLDQVGRQRGDLWACLEGGLQVAQPARPHQAGAGKAPLTWRSGGGLEKPGFDALDDPAGRHAAGAGQFFQAQGDFFEQVTVEGMVHGDGGGGVHGSASQSGARVEGQFARHGFIQFAGLGRVGRRQREFEFEVHVAGRVVGAAAGDTVTLQAQLAAFFPAGRHGDLHPAGGRGHFDLRAQRGFPGRQRQAGGHVAALHAVAGIGLEKYFEEQVAGRAAGMAGAALAAQADLLAFDHAPGDLDIERAVFGDHMAGRVEPCAAQADVALGAVEGIEQVELDLGVVIGAALGLGFTPVASCTACAAAPMAGAAEQLFEEVAVVLAGAGTARAIGELETGVPVGRGAEVALAGGLVAQRVIGDALLGIGQHGLGFVELGHAGLRVGFLADVRVVLARQLAVGLLDLVRGGGLRHTENLVVVLEFHDGSPELSTFHAILAQPARRDHALSHIRPGLGPGWR